ncbi:hypothetical protein ACS0TY_011206 [Phlomoides rotata]
MNLTVKLKRDVSSLPDSIGTGSSVKRDVQDPLETPNEDQEGDFHTHLPRAGQNMCLVGENRAQQS